MPTIIKTINDDQVGKIFQFAVDNFDVMSGISYQPVAFTGRFSREERERQRYTLSDLARDLESQAGRQKAHEDWYPLSVTSPFSKLLTSIWKYDVAKITSHADCGIGTYIFENVSKSLSVPFERFYLTLHKYGNISSASCAISLDEAARDGTLSYRRTFIPTGPTARICCCREEAPAPPLFPMRA